MTKVKFLKVGRFAGNPREPQLSIAKQDVGNVLEVSDSLAEISIKSGVAVLYVEEQKTPPIKDKAKAESK